MTGKITHLPTRGAKSGVTDLLELMQPPPKPTWRGGEAIGHGRQALPSQDGDLTWFAHDYRDHRKGGRWFRYNASWSIWECLDPFDQLAINQQADLPPRRDASGCWV